MSEYQFYEFKAIDKPSSEKDKNAIAVASEKSKADSLESIEKYSDYITRLPNDEKAEPTDSCLCGGQS